MANQIQLMIYEGHMVAAPDMRFMENGRAVCNFRMGSNSQWKNKDGEVMKETTWLKVTAWAKLAEIVNEYCGKGAHVIVTGKLRVGKGGNPDTYEMKDGNWGASYEVVASEVRILDGKKDGAVAGTYSAPADDVDIPF
jgi:single-strand DNA-binding protein